MAYEFEKLQVTLEDGVLTVLLNNPPANALGQPVVRDISGMLDLAETDDNVRVIVIAGTGDKLFSAGADIGEFAGLQSGTIPKYDGNTIFRRIETFPKIVIAALQGSAFGGGLELSLCCHMRIMSEKAVCGLPEVKLGFMPGWGGTQRLPRIIGSARALEYILSGDFISAKKAHKMGLVNRLAEDGEVIKEAQKWAAKLAAGAPVAQREILKAVYNGLVEKEIQKAVVEIEGQGTKTLLTTEDFKEGAKAFLEKRKAEFVGK